MPATIEFAIVPPPVLSFVLYSVVKYAVVSSFSVLRSAAKPVVRLVVSLLPRAIANPRFTPPIPIFQPARVQALLVRHLLVARTDDRNLGQRYHHVARSRRMHGHVRPVAGHNAAHRRFRRRHYIKRFIRRHTRHIGPVNLDLAAKSVLSVIVFTSVSMIAPGQPSPFFRVTVSAAAAAANARNTKRIVNILPFFTIFLLSEISAGKHEVLQAGPVYHTDSISLKQEAFRFFSERTHPISLPLLRSFSGDSQTISRSHPSIPQRQ